MTHSEAFDILVTAFSALGPEYKSNLLWHAENGMRIACGSTRLYGSYFVDGYG